MFRLMAFSREASFTPAAIRENFIKDNVDFMIHSVYVLGLRIYWLNVSEWKVKQNWIENESSTLFFKVIRSLNRSFGLYDISIPLKPLLRMYGIVLETLSYNF